MKERDVTRAEVRRLSDGHVLAVLVVSDPEQLELYMTANELHGTHEMVVLDD